MSEENTPLDWRGTLFGAVAAAVIGLIVAWSGRPTPESAQQVANTLAVQSAATVRVDGIAAQITALAAKIDTLSERSYLSYTRADAAADRAEAARRADALEARLVRLEQTVSDMQRSQPPLRSDPQR